MNDETNQHAMNQNEVGTQEIRKQAPKLTKEIIVELRRLLQVAQGHAVASKGKDLLEIDRAPLYEALGALEGFAPQLLDAAEIGVKWNEDSSLEKWFPFDAEELAKLKAALGGLKMRLDIVEGQKAAAEAETDAFMEYHEQEMQHVYGIRQAHGTAVVAIQVDRQQFLHARTPERLEEMVKLVTIQTLEALLAGTPGREVFDRLTRELVRQRSAANQG